MFLMCLYGSWRKEWIEECGVASDVLVGSWRKK
jgi:hypothetical protein